MKRRKGQFMLISSVLIGFIVISAASTISQVQEQQFETDSTDNTIQMLKDEAREIDHTNPREVDNYIQMVSMISGYRTEAEHWSSENCFNVTLQSSARRVDLACIG